MYYTRIITSCKSSEASSNSQFLVLVLVVGGYCRIQTKYEQPTLLMEENKYYYYERIHLEYFQLTAGDDETRD